MVITPTASGKTLCYNAPGPACDPAGSVEPRALSVPDQGARAGSARRAADAVRDPRRGRATTQIGVFTYDGDTPQDARRTIRARAHLVLSNPDMVHSGILPHHPRWAKLFENLRYVVIDELHAYRGVFGSHLCNVLRRLRRICRHYGSNPVFLCSSATIANPRELAERLTEQPFELVDEERRAARREVLRLRQSAGRQPSARDPPLVPERDAADRGGVPEAESAADRLRAEPAVDRDPDDLPEGRFRRRSRARPSGSAAIAAAICRTGAARSRRGCATGAVRAVVSTNALELGIDIGALDVAVMAGYPGTIAATWQRAGRAGRRASRSAAVMVASQRAARSVHRAEPVVFLRRARRSAR